MQRILWLGAYPGRAEKSDRKTSMTFGPTRFLETLVPVEGKPAQAK